MSWRAGCCLGTLLAACQAPAPEPIPRAPLGELTPVRREASVGTEILVAGQRFDIGTPVVLWFEGPKYDAYASGPRFPAEGDEGIQGLRYKPGRVARNEDLARRVSQAGWTLSNLQEQVDQFVLHYDAAGCSQTCFKVLQDMRQLSVHFMLDVDGTLYQTLDLKEQAWHASQANPRSIGVEIAHIGAYPEGQPSALDAWYQQDAAGRYVHFPAKLGDAGLRRAGFRGRPARQELIVGRIQGGRLQQFDYTQEQYAALAQLGAGLARVFPLIRLDAPRSQDGSVRTRVLSAQELDAFQGILGHYHVSASKIDPGPALHWSLLLERMRQILLRP